MYVLGCMGCEIVWLSVDDVVGFDARREVATSDDARRRRRRRGYDVFDGLKC